MLNTWAQHHMFEVSSFLYLGHADLVLQFVGSAL